MIITCHGITKTIDLYNLILTNGFRKKSEGQNLNRGQKTFRNYRSALSTNNSARSPKVFIKILLQITITYGNYKLCSILSLRYFIYIKNGVMFFILIGKSNKIIFSREVKGKMHNLLSNFKHQPLIPPHCLQISFFPFLVMNFLIFLVEIIGKLYVVLFFKLFIFIF